MGSYTYACKDYPSMDECRGQFEAETEEELWKHIELHASAAHQEDHASWPPEEIANVRALIKRV